MHLFGHTFDHDYYFELLREGGAGCSINSSVFYLHTMATLAIFRPRRIIKWKYWLRHSGRLRAVTWAASTNKKRNIELPCLVICPSRRRFPLESSNGHQSQITRDLLPT